MMIKEDKAKKEKGRSTCESETEKGRERMVTVNEARKSKEKCVCMRIIGTRASAGPAK